MNPLVTTGQDRRRDATALSVNVNKIALLRNQRPLAIPSVVGLARIALEAGAHGITVHPRPDERHIRAGDVRELAALLKDWPDAELNIEGNPYQNLMPLVRELRPHQCTFVPDDAAQATSDHGWDLARRRRAPRAARRRGALARRPRQPVHGRRSGRDGAGAGDRRRPRRALHRALRAGLGHAAPGGDARRLSRRCAKPRSALGLGVNAGHDLNRDNLGAFLAAVPGVLEVSIGHAFDRRRARARHGRDGARLSSRHRVGVGTVTAAPPLGRR